MLTYLDFEKPIAELEARVRELKETADNGEIDIQSEIDKLEGKASKLLTDTYSKLSPWQKAQVARHPERPHFKDYVAAIADEFIPLAGDRSFGEDPAIIGGFAKIDGRKATKRATTRPRGSSTISGWPSRRAIAKPSA